MNFNQYDDPAPRYGSVICGINMRSQPQALLLQQILEEALRDRAGKPEEGLLTKWHQEVVRYRREAKRECWVNWE